MRSEPTSQRRNVTCQLEILTHLRFLLDIVCVCVDESIGNLIRDGKQLVYPGQVGEIICILN